tara:strand:- start:33371 stop:34345 length:975 start_codon:yes stop_codon:yes gene_type:complete
MGIIGAGGMGNKHARDIRQRTDAEVIAVCDPDQASIERITKTLGITTSNIRQYSELSEMLGKDGLEAVVIATPHTQHNDHVKVCLDAGLHVLVEKPMATTVKAAREFISASERNDRILAIAYQRHGLGKFIRARQLLQEGAIGEIRFLNVLIAQNCIHAFQPGEKWRGDPVLSGGGHFIDTGSHINDIMLWTTGLEPKQVQASLSREGILVDVLTGVVVKFTSGALGTLAFTSLSPAWREEFTFYGTEGELRFGDSEPLRLHRTGEDIILPDDSKQGDTPLHNFVDSIRGKAQVQAPPICGLRVVQLTEAVYKAAESGRAEEVE